MMLESAETNPSDATATYCLPTIGTEETDREIGRIIDRDAGVTVASTIAEPTIAEPTVAQSKVVEALDLRRDRVLLRRGETADNGAHTTATAMYHEDGMDHSVDEMDHSVEEMDHSVVEMDHSGDETADRSAPHPLRLLDLALRRAAARALHPDAETRPDAETHPDVVLRYESDQGLDPAHPNATRIVLADLETEANHLLPKGRGRTQEAGPGVEVDPRPHQPLLAVPEATLRQAAAAAGAGAGAGAEVEAGPGRGRVGARQMSRTSDEEAGNRQLVDATAPRHLHRGAAAELIALPPHWDGDAFVIKLETAFG